MCTLVQYDKKYTVYDRVWNYGTILNVSDNTQIIKDNRDKSGRALFGIIFTETFYRIVSNSFSFIKT